jgi:dipeptidyl aminopeptidase/acylaminoacyl peptidase
MKKILSVICLLFLVASISVTAQTREEILKVMEPYISNLPQDVIDNAPQTDDFGQLLDYFRSHLAPPVFAGMKEDVGRLASRVYMKNNPQKKPIFDATRLMSLIRLSDPHISPDGTKLLFRLNKPNLHENEFHADLFVIDVNTMKQEQITRYAANEFNGRWDYDGKRIGFIVKDGKLPQVHMMSYPDGKPEKITDTENGTEGFLWSPDGQHILFTSDVKIHSTTADKYPKYDKANIRIYDDLPVRHWDHWNDEKFRHIFIQKIGSKEAIDIMPGEPYDAPLKPFGGIGEICWSPNGDEIAYTCKKVDDYEWSTNSEIYVYDLQTKQTKNITEGMPGYDKNPLYSPDGRYIAFTSQARPGFESDKIRLMLYNRQNGKIHEITTDIDQWVHEFIWSPDGEYIYFTAEDGPTVQIYQIDVESKDWKIVSKGWYNFGHGLDISPDGKTLYFGRQDMKTPMDFYSMPTEGGKMTKITKYNDLLMNDIADVKITQRWIRSTDGKEVHCWVLYPPEFDSTKKYPMITYCQGGPQATISQRFHFRWNYFMMASHGYIVLCPNRRGMPGFGQEWNDAITGDWGGMPMNDIMAATDALSQEHYVDKAGRAAVGASAGGYAAFWLAGHHNGRYSAFISHCGVFNLESMYGSTEELFFPNWEYGGPYWEGDNQEWYDKHSPHRYIKNWTTPMMITTGENDFRVPYTQSLEAFTAAQVMGVPSKLLVFPDETHFIAKPQEYIIWADEFFNWLDKYCK